MTGKNVFCNYLVRSLTFRYRLNLTHRANVILSGIKPLLGNSNIFKQLTRIRFENTQTAHFECIFTHYVDMQNFRALILHWILNILKSSPFAMFKVLTNYKQCTMNNSKNCIFKLLRLWISLSVKQNVSMLKHYRTWPQNYILVGLYKLFRSFPFRRKIHKTHRSFFSDQKPHSAWTECGL